MKKRAGTIKLNNTLTTRRKLSYTTLCSCEINGIRNSKGLHEELQRIKNTPRKQFTLANSHQKQQIVSLRSSDNGTIRYRIKNNYVLGIFQNKILFFKWAVSERVLRNDEKCKKNQVKHLENVIIEIKHSVGGSSKRLDRAERTIWRNYQEVVKCEEIKMETQWN